MQSRASSKSLKWYLKPFWVWVAILSVGPLAIPLLIASPAFSRITKWILSVVMILLTAYMVHVSVATYRLAMQLADPATRETALRESRLLSPDSKEFLRRILELYGL